MSNTKYSIKVETKHWYILFILVLFWGSSFAFNKIAVRDISPMWVVALRISIGAVLLIAYLFAKRLKFVPTKEHIAWFVGLGALGTVAPFTLISWGVQFVPSSIAGILMATVPLAVIILAHFILPDEKLSSRKASGFLIGFVGVVILVGVGGVTQLQNGTMQLWALLGITLAALCYALNGTLARHMPRIGNVEKSVGVLLAAALMALPMAWIFEPNGLVGANSASLLAVIVLGIFPTALATVLLFKVLTEAGASFLALSNYLVPVFAVFLGVTFLGETLVWSDWVGFGLVLSGILITERKKKPAS
ncbi:MAG: EamA family transporter [Hyphomicrobiales bacterium]|nr:MAG: EamA family transporter [Hyphomicrobiales bacterium]